MFGLALAGGVTAWMIVLIARKGYPVVLLLLALVMMGWLAHQTTVQFRESFYWVTHTYKILDVLEQTESHIVDAEAGRRGYLLTGRTDYLIPFDNSRSLIRSDIRQLQTLTGDGISQRTHIMELQNLVAEQLSLDPETIAGKASMCGGTMDTT